MTLATSEGEELTKEVTLPPKATFEDSITWQAEHAGKVTLTLKVPPQSGEFQTTNNELDVDVDVRKEALKVLLVESYPRWEYRYFRNALVRDPGVEVGCYLIHPDIKGVGGGPHYLKSFPTKAELSAYDVVFIGDDPNEIKDPVARNDNLIVFENSDCPRLFQSTTEYAFLGGNG